MAKNTRPGEGLSHNPANRGDYPSKETLLPSVANGSQTGSFCPRVTSGSQKTGCAKRIFSVQRPFLACESVLRGTWVQGLSQAATK